MNSSDKLIALVTGANKGIGLETVRQLAERGYIVYLACRDPRLGEQARKELDMPQADIRVVQLDVTAPATLVSCFNTLQEAEGRLDVLVNNAGVQLERLAPTECTEEALRQTYEVNVFGPVLLTQRLMPLLRAGARRTIVNVSSELGSLSLHSYPDFAFHRVNLFAYNSSKAALNAFTVLLAKELLAEGFKVNSVNPGYTKTGLNQFNGTRSVAQAAEVIVHYATLDASGPTGGFFMEGGPVPW